MADTSQSESHQVVTHTVVTTTTEHTNGITTEEEDEKSKMRPADIDAVSAFQFLFYVPAVAPSATFQLASVWRFSGIIQVHTPFKFSPSAILTGNGNGEVDGSVCHEPGGTVYFC
jgi:hypothetical protein